jgi:activator of HSP90 ATPase
MKELHQTYLFNVPLNKVWQAIVDPSEINKWGAGPCQMSEDNNTTFSLWDGDIIGKNIEIQRHKKIRQEWKMRQWETPSIVSFELSEKDGKTLLDLQQEGIPEDDFDGVNEGWDTYYFGAMKKYLEGDQ